MRTAMYLFRVASTLVLLASLLAVSGASASTGSPVNVAWCTMDVRVVSSEPLVVELDEVMVPDIGPGGKQGFEGVLHERAIVRIKTNSPRQAIVREELTFDGRAWEAGNVEPWSGHLEFLNLASGGPSDVHGTMRTIDSNVHFVGSFVTTPESDAKCRSLGYPLGGSKVTGELHITPARR